MIFFNVKRDLASPREEPRNRDGAKNTPTTGAGAGNRVRFEDGEWGSTPRPHPARVPCLVQRNHLSTFTWLNGKKRTNRRWIYRIFFKFKNKILIFFIFHKFKCECSTNSKIKLDIDWKGKLNLHCSYCIY